MKLCAIHSFLKINKYFVIFYSFPGGFIRNNFPEALEQPCKPPEIFLGFFFVKGRKINYHIFPFPSLCLMAC